MQSKYSKSLENMASLILKPLIEVLIRNDFTHNELTALVRQSYVDVAYEEFSISDQKMTYSRVAALTGICRKEVVRLKNNVRVDDGWDYLNSIEGAKIVNAWMCDKNYTDSENKPIELSITGSANSFEQLVDVYGNNTTYEAMLLKLNKAGITSQFNSGKVRLERDECVLNHRELEQIQVMSVCVSDLFSVATDSEETSNNDIRFHRQLVYSGIEEHLAKQFHDVGNDKAMAFFEALTEFMSTVRHESTPELYGSEKRVGLGIYFFDGAKQVKSVKMTSEENA